MKDIEKYNSEMKKSLVDKIFFIDKIESTVFIDYGCADGIMIKFLADLFPDNQFIGYDNNSHMRDIAKAKNDAPNIHYTTKLENLYTYAGFNDVTLITSSVMHEIYNYRDDSKPEYKFWDNVKQIQPKYVVIRDMCISNKIYHQASDLLSVSQIYHKVGSNIISQWESRWGSLNEKKSLIHFLLKYRYVSANWDREFVENYLSYDFEQLLYEIPQYLNIKYVEHYTLPYIKNAIKKDFNIDFNEKTHVKLILERI